jgi:DNA-binding response OmpR family regulator
LPVVATTFQQSRYGVITADLGRAMLDEARRSRPDVVILSAEMDDLGGLDFISRARLATCAPILVLTQTEGTLTPAEILAIGEDDYLAEPFSHGELVARARQLLRRARADQGPRVSETSFGRLRINSVDYSVSVEGKSIVLTRQEFDLLVVLASANGGTLDHNSILRKLWGRGDSGARQNLRRLVNRLRRKLEPVPARPACLVTVRGSGYRLDLQPEAANGKRVMPSSGTVSAGQQIVPR